MAQAEDWDGHHQTAQAMLVRRLQDVPNDLEARRLLAQSLVWSGRPDKALDEIHRALEFQADRLPHRPPSASRPVTKLGGLDIEAPVAAAGRNAELAYSLNKR